MTGNNDNHRNNGNNGNDGNDGNIGKNGKNENNGSGQDPLAHREAVRGELDGDHRLGWLLRQKVTIPERPPGYMDRPGLVARAMPTGSRLKVIVAPGGFGKTTLLAECCRHLVESGVVTAWLSIDPNDGAEVLDAYLAFAFRYAGLDVPDLPAEDPGPDHVHFSRVARLLHVLEARDERFVLALDDLQRLSDPRSVSLLEFLARRGPSNLHLAVACRRLPALDFGGSILTGEASALTVGDLRFSSSEIGKFFGQRLSRRELHALKTESAGWPMALRIHRNQAAASSPADGFAVRDIVGNWVEARLWEGMEEEDRELLLDAGLLEWMDAGLLGEVLGPDAMRRIGNMDALTGLLNPVRGGGRESWRLHPLIREHCARQRYHHARPRYRELHRRIALALERRGETLQALRHAAESGDAGLAGGMLENAGGVRLWIRYGLAAFRSAIGLLDEDVLRSTPRLALARCASLLFSGRLAEAREAYRAGPDPAGGGPDDPFWVDDRIVHGLLDYYGGGAMESERTRTAVADLQVIAASPAMDPLIQGYAEHGLCVAHTAMGQFGEAGERAERALARFGGNPFAQILVGFQRGQAAMAQGHVEPARNEYVNALRIAKARFLDDPASIAIASALLGELDLERHRQPPDRRPAGVPAALMRNGTPLQAYAAASGVAVGRALCAGDGSEMAVLQDMLEFVQSEGLPALVRNLSAMRVSLLAAGGLAGEAEACWRGAGLPEDPAECLDRTRQTWREMEALSSARLRLLMAEERFGEARDFARALRGSAAEGGLRRTLMRTLVLEVVLEHRAGDPARQRRRLEAFLAFFAETDYAWYAVWERDVCRPAVEAFLADAGDSRLGEAAEALLMSMGSADATPALVLSERELAILERLDTLTDKAIAADLALTPSGVRYHLRNLFSRLGAKSREEAVRRAREAGLVADGGDRPRHGAAEGEAPEPGRAG